MQQWRILILVSWLMTSSMLPNDNTENLFTTHHNNLYRPTWKGRTFFLYFKLAIIIVKALSKSTLMMHMCNAARQKGGLCRWGHFEFSIWCIRAFSEFYNDTSFFNIDQDIQISQSQKDCKFWLFSLLLSMYVRKSTAIKSPHFNVLHHSISPAVKYILNVFSLSTEQLVLQSVNLTDS